MRKIIDYPPSPALIENTTYPPRTYRPSEGGTRRKTLAVLGSLQHSPYLGTLSMEFRQAVEKEIKRIEGTC